MSSQRNAYLQEQAKEWVEGPILRRGVSKRQMTWGWPVESADFITTERFSWEELSQGHVFEEYQAALPPPPTPAPVYVPPQRPANCDRGNACSGAVNNGCIRCRVSWPNVIGVCV